MITKTDANQQEIADALRACGAFVFDLHEIGKGCPDLLVCWHGHWMLCEVKSNHRRLTPEQVLFINKAGQCGGKVYIIQSRMDAVEALNQNTRRE